VTSDTAAFLEGLDHTLSDKPQLWKQCPNCRTRDYCDHHRCKAMNYRGKPCPNPADPARGFEYCAAHGCRELLVASTKSTPSVLCMNRCEKFSGYCADHRELLRPYYYDD
jgi:hypothetical protein